MSSNGINEDEAALYDRQIRLWGVEAQNKMRTSSVLLVNLRGVACEVAKNIVLAGVGKVTLLDGADVAEEDLGANYFVREDEVGNKRVEAAAPRIQALNPRVNLETKTDSSLLQDESFISSFDLIVLTDVCAKTLHEVNTLTRKLGKKVIAASSVGQDGWIFADLLSHETIVDRVQVSAAGESVKVPTKISLEYVPFEAATKHSFAKLRPRQLKKETPQLWATLTLFATQLASLPPTASNLVNTSLTYLPSVSVTPALVPTALLERIARTAEFEFPPSAAVIGGVAGQDVLNALGGKEEPVRNLMVFDGQTSLASTWQLGL